MRNRYIIGSKKPTEIKYKKKIIEKVRKDGVIEKIITNENEMIKGNQGGNHLESCTLYPEEILKFIDTMEKLGKSARDDLINFEMTFMLGMRYEEAKWAQNHPENYDKEAGNFKISTNKVKVKDKIRLVRLSTKARNIIQSFFNADKKLPTMDGWNKKLKYYAKLSGMSDAGISSRMMRKTYESWLMFYYPDRKYEILQSQGHSELTALRHYIKTSYNEKDKIIMKEFVDGWI